MRTTALVLCLIALVGLNVLHSHSMVMTDAHGDVGYDLAQPVGSEHTVAFGNCVVADENGNLVGAACVGAGEIKTSMGTFNFDIPKFPTTQGSP